VFFILRQVLGEKMEASILDTVQLSLLPSRDLLQKPVSLTTFSRSD